MVNFRTVVNMIIRHLFIFILLLAISCSTVSNKVVIEKHSLKNQASEHSKTAIYYLDRYEYEKAIEYYIKSLNANIFADNIQGIILNYADLGKIYLIKGQMTESLKNYNNALELCSDYNELKEEKAFVLNGIGEIYYFLKDFEGSKKYYNDSLKIVNELKDNAEMVALISLNLSKIEKAAGNTEASLNLLFKSSNLYESVFASRKIKNSRNLALCYYLIGQNYYKLEKYQQAENYIIKALEIDKLIENSMGIADDYYALGMVSEKMKKSDSTALKYYLKSRQIYKLLDDFDDFIELTDKILAVYSRQNDMKNFILNKRIIISVTKGETRDEAVKEVLNLLKDENIKKLFTDEELHKIKTSMDEK